MSGSPSVTNKTHRRDRLYLRCETPSTCENCAAEFFPYKHSKGQRFCSWACYRDRPDKGQAGENNHNWRGGISKQPYRYKKRFAAENPEKVRAHRLVAYAKQTGKLVPGPCESCGSEKAHAHHEDYSKPLEVRWLCRLCHNRMHSGPRARSGVPAVKGDSFVWRGKVRR